MLKAWPMDTSSIGQTGQPTKYRCMCLIFIVLILLRFHELTIVTSLFFNVKPPSHAS